MALLTVKARSPDPSTLIVYISALVSPTAKNKTLLLSGENSISPKECTPLISASWVCPEDMPVGFVAMGYGDGYPRHAKPGTPVLVTGQRVPLIGRESRDSLYVDLRKGAFSNNTLLQLTDWQAPASKSAAGKIPSTSASNWHTLNLAAANFKFITKLGVTQFRLRFAKQDNGDNGADTVNFYSGNAIDANRPKLIITYYVP